MIINMALWSSDAIILDHPHSYSQPLQMSVIKYVNTYALDRGIPPYLPGAGVTCDGRFGQ